MNKKLPLIERGVHGSIQFQTTSSRQSWIMMLLLATMTIILFLLFFGRLFQLTIVKGSYYQKLADRNRVNEIIIEPQRGKLLDRKGLIIAQNTAINIKKQSDRITSKRLYYQPEVFAHLVGYRQIADKNDIKNDPCRNELKVGDKVGKKGVEKLWECELRGEYGKKLIEINAKGQNESLLNVVYPKHGKDIQLAVDSVLQEKAWQLIQGKQAVVVGLKPKTGEVLTLVSSPSFNPQLFEDGETDKIESLFNDKTKPLFNRATEGIYPPGSAFKLVLAAGALEDKTVTQTTQFEDKGFIQAGPLTFHNWYYLQYGKAEGMVDMTKAIQRSNDTYFYLVGSKMGELAIKRWAERFGFQRKSGIGIEEAEGIIPSAFWKEDTLKEQWFLGDTYNLAIGQGYVAVTPLQVAVATSVFANDGYLCQPQLRKVQPTGDIQAACKKLPLSQKTLHVVREGMKKACMADGTGWPFFDFKVREAGGEDITPIASDSAKQTPQRSIQVGCKTGTAESHAASGKPHAWFTVFAPFDNPEIVLTVLVEEGGQGSDVAAPIAKEILKTYFEQTQ